MKDKNTQQNFVVKLKNKNWWQRNRGLVLSSCAIAFLIILIFLLSFFAHRSYNFQQVTVFRRDSIQSYKDSTREKQFELIYYRLSDIDKTIKDTYKLIRRVKK
jgi:hypothetical protein